MFFFWIVSSIYKMFDVCDVSWCFTFCDPTLYQVSYVLLINDHVQLGLISDEHGQNLEHENRAAGMVKFGGFWNWGTPKSSILMGFPLLNHLWNGFIYENPLYDPIEGRIHRPPSQLRLETPWNWGKYQLHAVRSGGSIWQSRIHGIPLVISE